MTRGYPRLEVGFLSSRPAFFSSGVTETVTICPGVVGIVRLPVRSTSGIMLGEVGEKCAGRVFTREVRHVETVVPRISVVASIVINFYNRASRSFGRARRFIGRVGFSSVGVFHFSVHSKAGTSLVCMSSIPRSRGMRETGIVGRLGGSVGRAEFRGLMKARVRVVMRNDCPSEQLCNHSVGREAIVVRPGTKVGVGSGISMGVGSISPSTLCKVY